MAAKLNKNRMLGSRILVLLVLFASFVTAPMLEDTSIFYMFSKLVGYILLIACAIGRIYSTAFIGGIKNKELVTVGAYSVHRNPLYFYSLLGAAGIGLASVQLTSFIVIFFGFLFLYHGLISREEEFLQEKFGDDFTKYKKRVPCLLPKMKSYKAPPELLFQPKYFSKSIWDAIWWFAAIPVFEIAHYLQKIYILKVYWVLY